jgi:hypothetical protein
VTFPGAVDLSRVMTTWPAFIPGAVGAVGTITGVWGLRLLRGYRMRLEQAQEEFHILLRQHRTEHQDDMERMTRALEFLEQSGRNTEDALRGRLTHSLRAQAMQLLRSGMSAEKAASTMGMAKADLRLIAKVSRILSSS